MTASFAASRQQAQMNGLEFKQAGIIFCVDGTVYPGAPSSDIPPGGGFSSDMAYALMQQADGMWAQVFIGYPAVVTPMWPSVQIGRTNLLAAIKGAADAYFAMHGTYVGFWFIISGYSQGAMVTDQVYVLDILAEGGVLHYLLPCLVRMYNYGDIFRTPGIAHGNALSGLSESIKQDGVETGGIGGSLDLTVAQTNTPSAFDGKPIVCSNANFGDIYTCCPVGLNPWTAEAGPGKTGTTFFKIIMQATLLDIVEVALIIEEPVGDIEEMINALKFAAEGTNAPHWQYWPQMQGCVNEMVELGTQILAA